MAKNKKSKQLSFTDNLLNKKLFGINPVDEHPVDTKLVAVTSALSNPFEAHRVNQSTGKVQCTLCTDNTDFQKLCIGGQLAALNTMKIFHIDLPLKNMPKQPGRF